MELPHEGISEDLESLAAKTLRPPMRLSAEDLIASELASAIVSDPLGKIRHACEALMLLDAAERKQADITEEEAKEAEKLHALAMAMQNSYIHVLTDNYGKIVDNYASIAWTFAREEAESWLGWAEKLEPIYWRRAGEDVEKGKLANLNKFERMYEILKAQSTVGCQKIFIARFEAYAMPKAAVLMKKTIRLVSPDSYRQALQILRGGKRGKPQA